jgi:hypothetical protein
MLLHEIQPEYQFRQVRSIGINASPAGVYRNIWNYPINKSLLFRVLVGLRTLPARITGRGDFLPGGELTVSRWLNQTHFVLLAQEENKEIVFGLIGQFWKPLGGKILVIREADKFKEFEEPGYIKTAANFYIEPKDSGARLSLEVRVHATDKTSLRGFRFYLRIIEPFGGCLRTDMLKRIKSRAERVRLS